MSPLATGSALLGDWVANLVPVMGGELLLCLSERTLLTVVLPSAALTGLPGSLRDATVELLTSLGTPSSIVDRAANEIQAARLVRTDSRRFLGLLGEVSHYCIEAVDFVPPAKIRNHLELELHLSDWLHGPEPYRRPMDLLRELVDQERKR